MDPTITHDLWVLWVSTSLPTVLSLVWVLSLISPPGPFFSVFCVVWVTDPLQTVLSLLWVLWEATLVPPVLTLHWALHSINLLVKSLSPISALISIPSQALSASQGQCDYFNLERCEYLLFPTTSIGLWCCHADRLLTNAWQPKRVLMDVNSHSTEDLIPLHIVHYFYTIAPETEILWVI